MGGNIEYDDDVTLVQLLLPRPCVITQPETCTVRRPEVDLQEDLDDSDRLRQLRITALYIVSVADVVLRALAVVLTLMSLVLTNRDGHSERKRSEVAPVMFFLSGYMLSVNVTVCLYSFAILSLTIFQLIGCNARGSSSLVFLLSIFQLDQTFAYLLISASLNAFGCIGSLTCSKPPFDKEFCERTLASAIVSLLVFFTLAAASLISGFRLVARIRNYSPNVHLALCILLDDSCKDQNSLATKLLP